MISRNKLSIFIVVLVVVAGVSASIYLRSGSKLVSTAERSSAVNSIDKIILAAQAVNGLDGLSWSANLAKGVGLSGSHKFVKVKGTTIIWSDGTACFHADMPGPDSSLNVTPC